MNVKSVIIIFRMDDTTGTKIASTRLASLVSVGYEVVGSGAGNKRGFLVLVKCEPDKPPCDPCCCQDDDKADSEDDHEAARLADELIDHIDVLCLPGESAPRIVSRIPIGSTKTPWAPER